MQDLLLRVDETNKFTLVQNTTTEQKNFGCLVATWNCYEFAYSCVGVVLLPID